MNKHLNLVREYHLAVSFPQPEPGTAAHVSDMNVIERQALLMDGGSEAFKALKSGDMEKILAGLADLAYFALGALAEAGADVVERPVAWRHDGFVISVMRLLSDKIGGCADGAAEHYSEVYCTCLHLANAFLNADFDKAFDKVHRFNLAKFAESGQSFYDEAGKPNMLKSGHVLDLDDCLFE
ncbi:MAG: nucleoside triphosphate pyrophosphohydrolase family protein [Gammaproteobacteria bacterium]